MQLVANLVGGAQGWATFAFAGDVEMVSGSGSGSRPVVENKTGLDAALTRAQDAVATNPER